MISFPSLFFFPLFENFHAEATTGRTEIHRLSISRGGCRDGLTLDGDGVPGARNQPKTNTMILRNLQPPRHLWKDMAIEVLRRHSSLILPYVFWLSIRAILVVIVQFRITHVWSFRRFLLPSPTILHGLCKQNELLMRADFKCPAPCRSQHPQQAPREQPPFKLQHRQQQSRYLLSLLLRKVRDPTVVAALPSPAHGTPPSRPQGPTMWTLQGNTPTRSLDP